LSEQAVTARLAEYHAHRDELMEFYSSVGVQRINADQHQHTVFETLETLIVNPLNTCTASVPPACD